MGRRLETPGAPIQTFLPYADFDRTAAVLDTRRLGKQRVEVLQVMQVLVRHRWSPGSGVIEPFVPRGWLNHPVVLMWRGYEASLTRYQDAVCAEWSRRGFADTCRLKTRGLLATAPGASDGTRPPWLGDRGLHRAHQSNLVRKDPDYYGPRFPGVPPDLPYIWPVQAAASS
jgi:hypothetical protein